MSFIDRLRRANKLVLDSREEGLNTNVCVSAVAVVLSDKRGGGRQVDIHYVRERSGWGGSVCIERILGDAGLRVGPFIQLKKGEKEADIRSFLRRPRGILDVIGEGVSDRFRVVGTLVYEEPPGDEENHVSLVIPPHELPKGYRRAFRRYDALLFVDAETKDVIGVRSVRGIKRWVDACCEEGVEVSIGPILQRKGRGGRGRRRKRGRG